jgi:hypothetical protein
LLGVSVPFCLAELNLGIELNPIRLKFDSALIMLCN